MMKKRILLHVCCGPCATSSIEQLLNQDIKPVLFYSNSNILSREEYDKRLSYVEKVAEMFNLDLEEDLYQHDLWLGAVQGVENEKEGGERCRRCFRFNLVRTAEAAGEFHLDKWATTLTVSPYKNSKILKSVGDEIGHMDFHDFKKKEGYKRSILLSNELGLYRQNFCGCEFSLRDNSPFNES